MKETSMLSQLTAELLSNQIELQAGPPEKATRLDLDALWGWSFRGNVIHALAWLFECPAAGNRWQRHPILLDAIERAGVRLFSEMAADRHLEEFRRTGHPLIHGFALVRGNLRDASVWKAGIVDLMNRCFMPRLRERERLTVFSSANVGYGTNHLAVELSALAACIRIFGSDKKELAQMVPDRPDPAAYAKEYLKRFMGYMDPAGYWPECDGPANMYNTLTASALLRVAMDLDEVETYRAHFERAARFHTRYQFPNLQSAGVTDGRNPQGVIASRIAFCGFLPEGRSLLDLVARRQLDETRRGHKLSGEMLSELVTDIMAEPHFAPRSAPLVWETESYADAIRDDFAVLKQGDWMAALSNFVFRPRPEGHFTLDYQNLFSLYHRAFGVIFRGSNSKNDPELSTFNKDFTSFDGYPIEKPMRKHVPGKGRFTIRDDGFDLMRDYRGFEGYVSLRILSAGRASLSIRANARLSEYPITCSLQPAAGHGRGFRDARGNRVEIGSEPLRLTGAQLGGALILDPEPQPDAASAAPGRPVKVTLPDDAEVVWPFKAWDMYNLKTDRHEKPERWTLILRVPVSRQGAELAVEVV
jgi:hypothetical protein